MNKQAEFILRDAVGQILEHQNEDFIVSKTTDGFAVHFLNRPFVYFFSYQKDKGWLMDLLMENVHQNEVPYPSASAHEKLASVVDQCNIRYVLYKQKPKNNLLQQKKEIDAFFSQYQEILKERKSNDTELCYTFHPINEMQPRIAIEYNKENECWIIFYSDFNIGEKVFPPLKELYRKSQRLIFELNKQNV